MTPQAKAKLEENLKGLRTNGIFAEPLQTIPEGRRFLIISYGGAGADALFSIKAYLENHFEREQYEKSVRLLAIDTDTTTAKKTKKFTRADGTEGVKEVDALTGDQFFELSCRDARAALGDPSQLEPMKEWLHPDMVATVERDTNILKDGASATRQAGRIALSAQAQRLSTLIKRMGNQICAGERTSLEVMIIAGISGGTGSGIVIDATYIIRDALKSLGKKLLSVNGFIMLPPTGLDPDDDVKVKRGNRNGYAALKEIDHFMTTKERGDKYEQTLGTLQVTCEENLFDACFLVDATRDTILVEKPRECAKSVITNAVVDAIAASSNVAAQGADAAKSFLSLDTDGSAFRKTMLQNYSAEIAPRDVNYIYHAIGNSECYIPIQLIKAYVARETYMGMYEWFKRNSAVTDEDAINLVEAVILPTHRFSQEASEALVDKVVNGIVQSGEMGPYYAVNLLYRALEPGKGVDAIRSRAKLLRPRMVSDEQLNCIASRMNTLNNACFEVFTAAMDVMAETLEEAYGAATDTKRWDTGRGNSYSFTPIHLGNATGAAAMVKQYVDGLVDRSRSLQIIQTLLTEMMGVATEWSKTTVTMTDQKREELVGWVRGFWEEQIGQAVDGSVEDYLIKYYSGNQDAKYDPDDPKSEGWLNDAAAEIYKEMFGDGLGAQSRAIPLLGFTTNRNLVEPCVFNPVHYVFIPTKAPNLKAAFERFAAQPQNKERPIKVYSTSAQERISCFSQYSCVPAFKIQWVAEGETAYEDAVTGLDVGVHMSETSGGKNWKEFPNLCPESTWTQLGITDYGTKRTREKKLADRAHELFNKANKRGIARKEQYPNADLTREPIPVYYKVSILAEQYRPDVAAYTKLDNTVALGAEYSEPVQNAIDRDVQSKAQALYAIARPVVDALTETEREKIPAKVFEALQAAKAFGQEVELRNLFNTSIYSLQTTKANWFEDSAGMQLRRHPECTSEIRGTMDVYEALFAMLTDRYEENLLIKAFEAYLAEKLIYVSEELNCWVMKKTNGNEQRIYAPAKCGRTAPLYYVFNNIKGNEAYRTELKKAYLAALKEQIKTALSAGGYDKDDPETYSIIMTQNYVPTIEETVKKYSGELDKQCEKDPFADETVRIVASDVFEGDCQRAGEDYAKILAFYKRLNEDFQDVEAAVDNLAEYAAKLWCEANGIK